MMNLRGAKKSLPFVLASITHHPPSHSPTRRLVFTSSPCEQHKRRKIHKKGEAERKEMETHCNAPRRPPARKTTRTHTHTHIVGARRHRINAHLEPYV
jgi:hypothetical protein